MDQTSQENELQRAIDDITKNNGGQSTDVAANLEQQIQDQMGTPPVPPMPPVGDAPAEGMPMPEMPAEAGVGVDAPAGEPAVDGQAMEAPVVEAPAEVAAPADTTDSPLTDAAVEPATPDVAPETTDEPVVAPSVDDAGLSDMGGNDITSVKEAMLRDLFPIMDKVDMGAEEKFELYKTMLDDTNDKTLISGAYEVVKGITDEAARAEALLFLIKKADA